MLKASKQILLVLDKWWRRGLSPKQSWRVATTAIWSLFHTVSIQLDVCITFPQALIPSQKLPSLPCFFMHIILVFCFRNVLFRPLCFWNSIALPVPMLNRFLQHHTHTFANQTFWGLTKRYFSVSKKLQQEMILDEFKVSCNDVVYQNWAWCEHRTIVCHNVIIKDYIRSRQNTQLKDQRGRQHNKLQKVFYVLRYIV